MNECVYECKPDVKTENTNLDTYDKSFIEFDNDKIIKRIKLIFKDHYFISKSNLIKQYLVYIIIQLNTFTVR